jgi:hypothetical protein
VAGGTHRSTAGRSFAGATIGALALIVMFATLAEAAAPRPPRITTQPKSVTVEEGADVILTVVATGDAPLSFQWRFNGAALNGATSPSLTLKSVKPSDAGTYDVAVENRVGAAVSAPAAVAVASVDWGDAPSPYPTLKQGGGARHTVVAGFSLGAAIDGEPDGQPTPGADGDDLNPVGRDDEDGVSFQTLVPGQSATVPVFLSDPTGGPRRVDVFLDFNANGSWLDAGEHLVFNSPSVGNNNLSVAVPSDAPPGVTYARVRLSRAGTDLPTGNSPDGEVEDYRVIIAELDFGDAPEGAGLVPIGFPTTLARNGARHRIATGVHLGAGVDREPNGQPSGDALGDDNNPTTLDDEDGVSFPPEFIAGQTAEVQVTASMTGKLDAWVDFNRNDSWADAGEKVANSVVLLPGQNTITFTLPVSATPGETFARFRFSREGGLDFVGEASDGEVEDYRVTIVAQLLDFGDAPEALAVAALPGYPTVLASDGARHQVRAAFHLGEVVDGESDGQPTAEALGDDTSPPGQLDDEDGVQFLTPLVPGQTAQVQVIASASGRLDGWIDFDGNRSWLDAGEQIFTAIALAAGANVLTFLVPENASPQESFARFRFSRTGGLAPTGYGGPGEVEDEQVTVAERPGAGCEGGCGGTDFWLTFPGN